MIKVTLDTNCVINLLDRLHESTTSVESITEIIRYSLEGNVNVTITTRVESDISGDKDENRKNNILDRISMFPVISSIARFDFSKLNSSDILMDKGIGDIKNDVKNILFPGLKNDNKRYKNKINDIDHIVGCIINKRDLFVTDDKDLLRKSKSIEEAFGLLVVDPLKCIEYLDLKANKVVLIQEFYNKLVEYKSCFQSIDRPENYSELRNWLLKKYPIIKDGLLSFKLKMISIPAGNGQIRFDQIDHYSVKDLNDKIQSLFMKSDFLEQFYYFTECCNNNDLRRYIYNNRLEKALKKYFNNIEDLLISYIGYLESNF